MKTQCPSCKARFNVSEANIGKQAKCPKCTNPFTIEPFAETPVSAAAAQQVTAAVKTSAQPETPVQKAQPPQSSQETPSAKIAEQPKTNQPKSEKLSKILFVYGWAVLRAVAGILGLLGLMLILKRSSNSVLIMTFAAANIFMISSIVIEMMLFYKMWSVIQDGSASITPGKAVGFLFIPVFNLYWALLMLTGFPEDYNAFIKQRSGRNKELPPILFMIYSFLFVIFEFAAAVVLLSVFVLLSIIGRAFRGYPEVSWMLFSIFAAAGIAHFITHILTAAKTCIAVNALQK
ncbi:MAG: zinc-ribbon domain-containing protein [Phycisphaerae bacterium]